MNTKIKQNLKAKAHSLKPVVYLGAKGLTDAVMAEVDLALTAHELIKIKLAGIDNSEKKQTAAQIGETCSAEVIQIIGNILVLYRQNPTSP